MPSCTHTCSRPVPNKSFYGGPSKLVQKRGGSLTPGLTLQRKTTQLETQTCIPIYICSYACKYSCAHTHTQIISITCNHTHINTHLDLNTNISGFELHERNCYTYMCMRRLIFTPIQMLANRNSKRNYLTHTHMHRYKTKQICTTKYTKDRTHADV